MAKSNLNGVGRPTDLTDKLLAEIRELILDGKNLKEIANIKGISESTIYSWHSLNYKGLTDLIEGWKRDRKLILADITSDTIQTLPVIDDNGKLDKELLKIKQKEAEFIRETLGKQYYSKRQELTGKDGDDLIPVDKEIKDKVDKSITDFLNDYPGNIK